MTNKEWEKKMNERNAAHLLMTEFVKREASEIARAFESIVPLQYEVSYESLERSMSVVNQTFASVALKLIDHNSYLEPSDPNNIELPVGAKTMNDTIEEMSKFIHSVRILLFMLQDKFGDDPAIKLAYETFTNYQAQM